MTTSGCPNKRTCNADSQNIKAKHADIEKALAVTTTTTTKKKNKLSKIWVSQPITYNQDCVHVVHRQNILVPQSSIGRKDGRKVRDGTEVERVCTLHRLKIGHGLTSDPVLFAN